MKTFAVFAVFFLAFVTPAAALADLTPRVGVGVGGMQVIASQRLAVTPNLALDWTPGIESILTVGLREELGILLPLGGVDTTPSIHSRAALLLGIGPRRFAVSLGPTFAAYSMSVCSPTLCARTSGIAPGVEAHLAVYTEEWAGGVMGVQASGYLGWYDGSSAVLSRTPIAMFTAGPVFRFGPGR